MANNISFGNSSDVTGNFGSYEIIEQKTETISHSSVGSYAKTITMSKDIQNYIDDSLVIGYNIRGNLTYTLNQHTSVSSVSFIYKFNFITNTNNKNIEIYLTNVSFSASDLGIRTYFINHNMLFRPYNIDDSKYGIMGESLNYCNLNETNSLTFTLSDNTNRASQFSFPVTITVYKQNIR